jgi:hypothetical protein
VYVAALRWADPPSKESYQLSTRFTISELILNGNRSEPLVRRGRNRITVGISKQFRYFIKITSDTGEKYSELNVTRRYNTDITAIYRRFNLVQEYDYISTCKELT